MPQDHWGNGEANLEGREGTKATLSRVKYIEEMANLLRLHKKEKDNAKGEGRVSY